MVYHELEAAIEAYSLGWSVHAAGEEDARGEGRWGLRVERACTWLGRSNAEREVSDAAMFLLSERHKAWCSLTGALHC